MKTVLITGGSGYFGQAMARYMAGYPDGTREVNAIRIYSRGEAAQAAMRDRLGDKHEMRYLIGDVRDLHRLERAMGGVDIVIHAAALKRVEVGERDPSEMVETNVLGTRNVLRAAEMTQVQRVVVLSSDKACAPLNAYGATKLVAEKLAMATNAERPNGPIVSVVRYGNIAGSTGSVIPTWRALKHQGKQFTVTDPAATRFWMRVEEACQMVWWVVVNGKGGDMFVPSLPAYRVGDLAHALQGGHSLPPLTGRLGPGEKQHELMISDQEAPGFARIAKYWVTGEKWAPNVERLGAERRREALASNHVDQLSVAEIIEQLRTI